jgi:P pilus assembly chaperone PapD
MLVRSRLVAGALGLAVAGGTTGGVIARADDSAPRAQAAQATGGVSISPARVEHTAKRGKVGRFTVKNTTKDTLKVTVTVRPWIQNRATAGVVANGRANLTPYVRASPSTFRLKPGSRTVTLKMRRMTRSGSLYGGIQVFARQVKKKARNGIIPQWNVIGALRLKPKKKRPSLKLGSTRILGRGADRKIILEIRNLGNSISAVTGSVAITGPTPRNATTQPATIVPGQVVQIQGGSLRGMKAGNYTATWNVTQDNKRFSVRAGFRL